MIDIDKEALRDVVIPKFITTSFGITCASVLVFDYICVTDALVVIQVNFNTWHGEVYYYKGGIDT